MPRGRKETDCPITGFKFVRSSDELHKLVEPKNASYSTEDLLGRSFPKGTVARVQKNGERIWIDGETNTEIERLKSEKGPFLLASKMVDNLPITMFRLTEFRPCIDPNVERYAGKFHIVDKR